MLLFSGTASLSLTNKLATELAIPIGNASIEQFPDHEHKITIHSTVRGKHVCIIQSTSKPVNDNILELCLMINALRGKGASRITAVVPYFGYARQDLSAAKTGTPLSAQVVANIFNAMGIDHLITVDLHADRIKQFFNFTVDNLSSSGIFLTHLQSRMLLNTVIVSPDIGGATRACKFSKLLNTGLAVIAKQSSHINGTVDILGNVKDCDCIVIDDIVDTGNTLCNAARALKARGARKVYAYCTHAVLSGNALERLYASDHDQIVLTDTIELKYFKQIGNKVKQITIVQTLATHLQNNLF